MSGRSGAGVTRVGLISDTHGWLDPRAVAAFEAEEPLAAIVHAGDIGAAPDILYRLEAIAPVTAVLGNCDYQVAGWALEGLARVTVAGTRILVLHDFHDLGDLPEDVEVIVVGHSHMPRNELHGGVLVVNPGSATQRRRMPGTSVAILDLAEGARPTARIIDLDDVGPRVR